MPIEASGTPDDALDALYLEFSASRDWRIALNAARLAVGAEGAAVLAEYGDAPMVVSTFNVTPETVPDYILELAEDDPVFAASKTTPIEDVIRLGDLVDLDTFATTNYYRLVHEPNGIWDVLSMRLTDGRGTLSLSLFTERPRVFSREDAARAARFRSHLVRATALRARMKSVDGAGDATAPLVASAADEALTPAERRVAQLLVSGLTYKLAAEKLGVSENTVKAHVKSVYAKLGVSSRAELLRRA